MHAKETLTYSKDYLSYLEDYLYGKKESELYNKATGLKNFPDDCPDMRPVKGKLDLRRCICPSPQRPVALPMIKGKYISDDLMICWRCRAEGYRKERKTQTATFSKPKNKRQPDYCKRDRIHREYLDRTCLECKWSTSECHVKRRIAKLAVSE